MAGNWIDYWKIVQPAPKKTEYVTNNTEDGKFYNNFSWYTKVMKGASSRHSKYVQYRNMDVNVFVSRALDTIAENITPNNDKTDLPFEIVYQAEIGKDIPDHITVILKSAIRHWCDLHAMSGLNFDIARTVIKYGDCFFRKTSDFKKWEYIAPQDILGVEIDKKTNTAVRYQIRKSQTSTGNVEVDIVPAEGIIHFSLASLVAEGAPFGESVLAPTVSAFRQLTLLEDSVIIYRIVRAPERRVFFIDVGNMPPQRIKSYLESIKNEVKQKRIPNDTGGQEKIDSAYNPLGMVEDYYFAQTANGRGSRVETLSGGENLGQIEDLTYFQNTFLQGLRIPSSYMRGSANNGSMINDGKVGVAYIEEQEFFNYITRLQNKIEVTFDKQFKDYLKAAGIKVDHNIFKIKLPSPQNFALYRQAAIDADLVSTFNNIKDSKFISRRFALKRYLGWTDEEIQSNEILLKQEQNIPEFGLTDGLSDVRMIYDDNWIDNKPKIKVSDKIDDFTEATGSLAGDDSTSEEELPSSENENSTDATSSDSSAENSSENLDKETPAPVDKNTETTAEEPSAVEVGGEEPSAEELGKDTNK
jgi:hypothetical protein